MRSGYCNDIVMVNKQNDKKKQKRLQVVKILMFSGKDASYIKNKSKKIAL